MHKCTRNVCNVMLTLHSSLMLLCHQVEGRRKWLYCTYNLLSRLVSPKQTSTCINNQVLTEAYRPESHQRKQTDAEKQGIKDTRKQSHWNPGLRSYLATKVCRVFLLYYYNNNYNNLILFKEQQHKQMNS